MQHGTADVIIEWTITPVSLACVILNFDVTFVMAGATILTKLNKLKPYKTIEVKTLNLYTGNEYLKLVLISFQTAVPGT